MKKIGLLNLSTIVAISAVAYLAYYLLLHENCLNCSISSIIASAHNLAVTKHMLVLGLLPIYIAAIIFGAGILGIYLGMALQQFLIRATKTSFDK